MGVFCESSGLLALICVYYETRFSFSADFWHSVKYVNYHITSFTIASFLYQVNYLDHFLHSDHKLYLCLLHISSQSFWSYSIFWSQVLFLLASYIKSILYFCLLLMLTLCTLSTYQFIRNYIKLFWLWGFN